MADSLGWISLHRQVQKHWIWKDPCKFQWWIDILLTVNNTDCRVNIGFEVISCKRGQSLMSIQSWALRWGVSKDTARNFLNLLEKDHMITRVTLMKTTLLTVCKYDDYQQGLHVKKRMTSGSPSDDTTQTIMSNNDNKINTKVFIAPSQLEVCQYFLDSGFTEASAKTAFEYYSRMMWKDSRGKKVTNWKLKMTAVWFKEENKIKSIIDEERPMVW